MNRTNEDLNIEDSIKKSLKDSFDQLNDHEDVQHMKDMAKDAAHVATEFIKKYPVQTVLGAAVVGYLLGRLTNKSHK
ncbi:MAG: hypothetical protein ACK41T_01910 [Pseudobdellovibrio sp.]